VIRVVWRGFRRGHVGYALLSHLLSIVYVIVCFNLGIRSVRGSLHGKHDSPVGEHFLIYLSHLLMILGLKIGPHCVSPCLLGH
jgi:hypothetical protein